MFCVCIHSCHVVLLCLCVYLFCVNSCAVLVRSKKSVVCVIRCFVSLFLLSCVLAGYALFVVGGCFVVVMFLFLACWLVCGLCSCII